MEPTNFKLYTEPAFLKNFKNIKELYNCPICNEELTKKVRKQTMLNPKMCNYCRYLKKLFSDGYATIPNCYNDGCTCKNEIFITETITCDNCLNRKCLDCGKKIEENSIHANKERCYKCLKYQQEKLKIKEFLKIWHTYIIRDRLNSRNVKDLRKLAKKKKIKNYYNMKRNALINQLLNQTTYEVVPTKT